MTVLSLNSLPLGYRFRPTDEELVDHYLRNKINGNEDTVKVIREIDVCKWEPWDLPELSVVQSTDLEWFFFCPRDQKYPNGPRLNRATEAGYWKATGKDRKIKNRVNELGMKKTLVFYKGRAPKGKRTNWVMHEYRPTLAELDGTHPGQNAFVLCRLFKKLDESVENSLCDEVEPALSSPTAINSSPRYTQSELALEQESLALGSQVANQPTNSESCQAEDFERSSPNVLVPLECHNLSDNAYAVNDHAAARTVTEVDPPQVEYGDWTSDPNLDPEDCKLFSPLSAQMRAELGSDMHYLAPNDFSNVHSGLQFQYGTNEQDAHISEFLNSILNDSEDDYYYGEPDMQKTLPAENKTPKYINCLSLYNGPVKDSGSCSESDQEMAQAQCEPSCCLVEREAPIKIESTPEAFRSQTFDNSFDVNFIDTCFLPVDCLEAKACFPSPEETSSHVNYIGAGNSATGIRIRTRQPEDYSTSTNFVFPQGIAHRRVRMQTNLEIGTLQYCKTDLGFVAEDDKEKSTVTEEEKSAENHDSDAASATTTYDEPQKLTRFESDEVIMPKTMTMRSTWIGKNYDYVFAKTGDNMFAKTGVRRSILSMLKRVGMVIVFCIVLAGLWTSLKYIKIA